MRYFSLRELWPAPLALFSLLPLYSFYTFGAVTHMFLLTFFLVTFLLWCCLSVFAVLVVTRCLWVKLCQRTLTSCEVLQGVLSVTFLFLTFSSFTLRSSAFQWGARARIEALGGSGFVDQLQQASRLIVERTAPDLGVIPDEEIPAIFKEIGCRAVIIERNDSGY